MDCIVRMFSFVTILHYILRNLLKGYVCFIILKVVTIYKESERKLLEVMDIFNTMVTIAWVCVYVQTHQIVCIKCVVYIN